ncbi:unnamed protein product [Rotaria magnacalcarata]|uniref:Uncharacterized protein n=1 Tax=Rotaria magnacalcarata TaxID=392030 RepID=A0A815EDA3_9BILA|nr:unnamed protein product [Rotaria magnacalcarata]CAF5164999.1 unnamed protein product [Rotaria magnacalcarata]
MNVYESKTKDILAQLGVGVQSECGKLDVVLMHRPGQELLRLTKDNLHQLLYDAIPNLKETHQSHDIFSQYLRDNGVHVGMCSFSLLMTASTDILSTEN